MRLLPSGFSSSRSRDQLVQFFALCGVSADPDGGEGTNGPWTLGLLEVLNEGPCSDERRPSDSMVRVIQRLIDEVRDVQVDPELINLEDALEILNVYLRWDRMLVSLDPEGRVQFRGIHGSCDGDSNVVDQGSGEGHQSNEHGEEMESVPTWTEAQWDEQEQNWLAAAAKTNGLLWCDIDDLRSVIRTKRSTHYYRTEFEGASLLHRLEGLVNRGLIAPTGKRANHYRMTEGKAFESGEGPQPGT